MIWHIVGYSRVPLYILLPTISKRHMRVVNPRPPHMHQALFLTSLCLVCVLVQVSLGYPVKVMDQ
jgi:hypothetical protein